jgi:hypothetical protein
MGELALSVMQRIQLIPKIPAQMASFSPQTPSFDYFSISHPTITHQHVSIFTLGEIITGFAPRNTILGPKPI